MLAKSTSWKLNVFVCVALLAYLFMDGGFVYERFCAIGGNAPGVLDIAIICRKFIFVVEYIISIGIIWMLTCISGGYGFVGLVLLFVFVFIDQCCYFIYGRPASIFNIAVLSD